MVTEYSSQPHKPEGMMIDINAVRVRLESSILTFRAPDKGDPLEEKGLRQIKELTQICKGRIVGFEVLYRNREDSRVPDMIVLRFEE